MAGEVANDDRVFRVFDEDGRAQNIISLRASAETANVSWDFSQGLNPDDSLSTATASVTEIGGSTLSIASVTTRHNRVNANITSLVADTAYTVRCTATTAEGYVLERVGTIHGV